MFSVISPPNMARAGEWNLNQGKAGRTGGWHSHHSEAYMGVRNTLLWHITEGYMEV